MLKDATGTDARQLALQALKHIAGGGYADVVLERLFEQTSLAERDRHFVTELVYGTVRRQRTLDALITQLASKPSDRQPPELRLILQLGLYQLRYLSQVPPSAAVNTTVNLAKANRLGGLAGVVNGLLRRYVRDQKQCHAQGIDVLTLPADPIVQLGIAHSLPDWIVQTYVDQVGWEAAARLCDWFNQPPTLDLRVNRLRTSVEDVLTQFRAAGVDAVALPHLPSGIRVLSGGEVRSLPGFEAGLWTVQDSSAQLVGHILDPQPGEVVIDACAAPGGKTTHIAELMGDRGTVWGCDRYANRLKRLTQSCERLGLHSVKVWAGDSRTLTHLKEQGDRVLVDAPCSGLGTLHRHADARWRQTPDTVQDMVLLQTELLQQAATWVKPGGSLVYSTCTLNPPENQGIVRQFLEHHPHWHLVPLGGDRLTECYPAPDGWLTLWPQVHPMDGFFIAKLQRSPAVDGERLERSSTDSDGQASPPQP